MPNRQTRRPKAREDVLTIWQYIANNNEAAATHLIRRIDRTIQMLAENPLMGRERIDLGSQIRSFPVGSYTVFYVPESAGVDILRVMHASRDIGPEDVA